MHDRISPRQLSALCFCAVCVPIFRFCCRVGWIWTAIGGAAAAILLSLLYRAAGRRPLTKAAVSAPGRIVLRILLISLLALAGWAGAESARAFPETEGSPLAAWLMLTLAAWAAVHGTAVLGRCAGILLPACMILYCIVLGFSAPQILPERLLPAGQPREAALVLIALLVPAAGIALTRDAVPSIPHSTIPFWLTALLATAASAVTGGILSPAVAAGERSFDVLAQSVSILGVMQRFEAMVSAAMLMSGFCLCGLFLGAAGSVLKTLEGERRGKRIFVPLLAISAVFACPKDQILPLWLGLIAICSGIAAILLQDVAAHRKTQKTF